MIEGPHNPIDRLIANAAARTLEVRVCSRGDLVDRHIEAVTALNAVNDADGGSLAEGSATRAALQAVKDVEDEREAETVTVTLQSISDEKWANLLRQHAPSKAERRAGHDHDPKTFPPAAVAACALSPEITVTQATALRGALPSGEWNKLWVGAMSLNVIELPHPKLAAATELLRASEASSTTPPREGSLAGGSSAGSGEQ